MVELVGNRIDKLRSIFFGFALNGHSALGRDQLRVALDVLAKSKEYDFDAVFLEMDVNGDGIVQAEEFTRWLGTHPGRLGGLNVELDLDELVEKLLLVLDKALGDDDTVDLELESIMNALAGELHCVPEALNDYEDVIADLIMESL